jgi:hypothetical protein
MPQLKINQMHEDQKRWIKKVCLRMEYKWEANTDIHALLRDRRTTWRFSHAFYNLKTSEENARVTSLRVPWLVHALVKAHRLGNC